MKKFIIENRVNCWNAKSFNGYANQQPSRLNEIKVGRKVQRLKIEDSTNNILLAPDTLNGDDIVRTYLKK